MKPWGTVFAKYVAQQLTSKPRLSVAEAVEEVKNQMLKWGLGTERTEEFAKAYQGLGPVFQHKGVLNPLYLDDRLDKRTFLHVIDAREGRYPSLRRFMEEWSGEHSRFILFGADDALVILYGTPEDEEAWIKYMRTDRGWPINDLPVVEISFLMGYRVRSPREEDVSDIPPDVVNQLVENYWAAGLEEARTRLEAANILLGPTVLEDLNKTGRIRAFMATQIRGGRFPQDHKAFQQVLLRTSEFRRHVRSIYHCMGAYHLVVELLCDNIQELDHITELAQQPEGAAYSVDTTSFVVANAEVEMLPTLSLATETPWEAGLGTYGTLVRAALTREIIPMGESRVKHFRELTNEEQLFLVQALEELHRMPLVGVEEEWEEQIAHAKEQFIAGMLDHSVPTLKGSVTSLSPAVEAAGRRALRITIQTLYLNDFGRAQRALGLSSAKFNKYTLGNLFNAFCAINEDPYYQQLDIVFPSTFLRKLDNFREIRNEFAHEEPGAQSRESGRLAREVREAHIYGLEVINWLGEHVLERDPLPWSAVPRLIEFTSSEAAEGILADISDTVQMSSDQIQALTAQLDAFEAQYQADTERLFRELAALSAFGSASSGQEKLWRHRLDRVLQKQDEILTQVEEPTQSKVRELLDTLRQTSGSVSLNLLANAIWYILMNVSPSYLPQLVSWILK